MVITSLRKFSRITNKTLEVIIEKVDSHGIKATKALNKML